MVTGQGLVCPNCGDRRDVVVRYEHVGGVGLVPEVQCRDTAACWDRRDFLDLVTKATGEDGPIATELTVEMLERLGYPKKGAS
jgi:hypothetical protein